MEKNNQLGQMLKQYREKAFPEMGLRRVAIQVGIDYAHLFRIEAGQYVPTDDSLLKLLNAYKVEPIEKLNIFNLARLTPGHQEVIDQAVKHYYKNNAEEFVGAFYRKNKNAGKRDEKNGEQQNPK